MKRTTLTRSKYTLLPDLNSNQRLFLCLGAAVAAFLGGVGLVLTSPKTTLLLILSVAAVLAFLARPKVAIGLLLLIRPSLEAFGDSYLPTPVGDVLNPAGIVTIALVLGLLIWVVDQRIAVSSYPLTYPYLAFLLACGISTLVSPNVAAAVGEWLRFASYLLLYIFVRNQIKSHDEIKRLLLVVILSSLVPIAVGFYQIAAGQVWVFYGIAQIRSLFAHMSGYGLFLVMVGTTTLIAFMSERRVNLRYGYGLLLALILYSLLRTYSRVAWVGFTLSFVTIGVAEYYKCLLLLPPALMAVWWWGPSVRDRIMLAFSSTQVEYNSLVTRLYLWQAALNMFRSNPVWGTGLRSFNTLNSYWAGRYTAFSGVQVHNTYIQFLAETGILGLGAFLWLQIALAKEAWQGIRRVHDPRLRPVVLAFAGMLVANLAMGLTDNLISSPVIQWCFWTFAALTGCAIELQAKDGGNLESIR